MVHTKITGQKQPNRRNCDTHGDPATYCQRRFTKSNRMRRLNRLEINFASQIMRSVGARSRVLDAPCGSGRFLEVFATAEQVVMLDLNPSMLRTLRANHGHNGPLNLIQADVSLLPFDDDFFELCFCMRLFHHIADDQLRRQMLSELARVSCKYVALSFYKTHSFRYLKRIIRGKKPSGQSVSSKKFILTAASVGLRLVRKVPAVSFIEQQQILLFEKK